MTHSVDSWISLANPIKKSFNFHAPTLGKDFKGIVCVNACQKVEEYWTWVCYLMNRGVSIDVIVFCSFWAKKILEIMDVFQLLVEAQNAWLDLSIISRSPSNSILTILKWHVEQFCGALKRLSLHFRCWCRCRCQSYCCGALEKFKMKDDTTRQSFVSVICKHFQLVSLEHFRQNLW